MADLRVLSVASEIFPLIKTGGLADVVGALPGALRPHGVEIRTLVPGYPGVMKSVAQSKPVHAWPDFFGGAARLLSGSAAGLQLLILDAPHLFDRPGNPYLDAGGKDWPDSPQRFAALSLAAAEIGRGLFSAFVPQVLHCHDWQSGLVPAYLQFGVGAKAKAAKPATVITIHNLAFQGQFPASLLADLQLPPGAFTMEGVEYYGGIGFLKAGLALADRITTVSPTYAGEIQGTALGMGLDGLLRHRSGVLSGILNGIDTAVWDPKTDAHLSARFDAADLKPRAANKAAIRKRLDLAADRNGPLFAVVSRLTAQKGIDLILEALPRLVDAGCQFAVLGSGEAALEAAFAGAALRHRGSVGVASGYDEPFAHLLQGGADAILVPSRFEPCGLTQLCALRYGSVPIVARTGGLADTVIDANDAALAAGVASGFQFAPVTAQSLASACDRALAAFREPAQWRGLQQRGMAQDVGWSRPAATYARLYKSLVVR